MKENLVEQIIKMANRYDDYMDYTATPIEFFKVKNKDRYSCLRFVFGSDDSVLFEIKSAENSYKDFKNLNNTKEKLFVFIKMLFNAILFLFFLANSVILYTKL